MSEVALGGGDVLDALRGERVHEAREAGLTGRHVLRTRHGADPAAAQRDQVVGGQLGPGPLVRLDVGDRYRPSGLSGEHGGQPGVVQQSGERIVRVRRDQHHPVHMPVAQV